MEALVQQHDAVMKLLKENQELKEFQRAATNHIKNLEAALAECQEKACQCGAQEGTES